MEIEAFLERLVNYGESKGLFLKIPIKDVKDSCCTKALTEVYDFDKCKELVSKAHNLNSPKSCDGLKIIPTKNMIDFIEFKGWKKFIEWQLKDGDEQEKIEQQINNFRLDEKITDSLLILESLMSHIDFKLLKNEKRAYLDTPKRFIILTDIEELNQRPLEQLTVTLGNLASMSSSIESLIAKKFGTEIKSISGDTLKNLQEPKTMTCLTIDKFYKDA